MAEETPGVSRFEPLSALWHVFAAPQALLVLLALITLMLALGTLIPQNPAQSASDPQAWQPGPIGLLGPSSGLIGALGLFDLYHSLGFRLVLALTGLCLFVRSVEAIELAWRAMGRTSWTLPAFVSWGRRPPQVKVPTDLSEDEIKTRLGRSLAEQGYWLKEVATQPVPSLVAGRRSLMLWSRPLGYAALLLALVGVAISGTWGWQSEHWQPIPGEGRALGHDTPYTIRLDRFRMQLGDDQRLEKTLSEITWFEGESEQGQSVIAAGQPAKLGTVTVRQLGYVPVVMLRGWDEDDQPLTLETGEDVLSVTGAAEIRFGSPEAQPILLVPDRDLFLALSFEPLCVEGKPALHIDRIGEEGADRKALGVLYESGSVVVDGISLDVELSFVPVLRADSRPAMWLVVAGMALLVIALAAGWVAPPRLVWLAINREEDNQILVQILALPGAGLYRWLPQLADRLRGVLSDDG